MDKATKILLGGIVTAILVVGVGYMNLVKSKSELSDLVAQCQSMNTRASVPKDKDGWESAPLVCNPEDLSIFESQVGIQAKIVDTQRHGEKWFEQAMLVAIGVAILSGIPWAWYFLLRRVRELRDAISGK